MTGQILKRKIKKVEENLDCTTTSISVLRRQKTASWNLNSICHCKDVLHSPRKEIDNIYNIDSEGEIRDKQRIWFDFEFVYAWPAKSLVLEWTSFTWENKLISCFTEITLSWGLMNLIFSLDTKFCFPSPSTQCVTVSQETKPFILEVNWCEQFGGGKEQIGNLWSWAHVVHTAPKVISRRW